MNDLPDVTTFLAAGVRADPRLCLAQAVAWLDPFWNGVQEDELGDDDMLAVAMDVTRRCFPTVYALAVQALHRGADESDLDRLICAEISATGLPLDSLEGLGYGVPLPAYGVCLEDPDFYVEHAEVIPLLGWFGISPENQPSVEVPDWAYVAGQRLSDSLVEQPDERYQQVGWLLGWLFSCTGNSVLDYDYETLYEFEPLPWEPDNLELALASTEEAGDLLEAARTGLARVTSDSILQQALRTNIRRLRRLFTGSIAKERTVHDRLRLHWPALDRGAAGTAQSDP